MSLVGRSIHDLYCLCSTTYCYTFAIIRSMFLCIGIFKNREFVIVELIIEECQGICSFAIFSILNFKFIKVYNSKVIIVICRVQCSLGVWVHITTIFLHCFFCSNNIFPIIEVSLKYKIFAVTCNITRFITNSLLSCFFLPFLVLFSVYEGVNDFCYRVSFISWIFIGYFLLLTTINFIQFFDNSIFKYIYEAWIC